MPRDFVSAIVLTYNVEHKLRPCLESLAFVDEIMVVDSGSTDDTEAIAKEYTDHFLVHVPYESYASQNNLALEKTASNWTLICDSDERVSPELRDEILAILEQGSDYSAFHIPRQNWFMGRHIRHGGWGNDTVVRFFRKDHCRFKPRKIHPELEVNGRTGRLSGHLVHEPYAGLDEWMERFQRYARWGAENALAKGHRPGWFTIGLRPVLKFIKVYFLRLGFLDGLPGLVIALFAMFSMFLRYLYLYEHSQEDAEALPEDLDVPEELM